MSIYHRFISPIPDEEDPDVAGPDEWNEAHIAVGGSDGYVQVWNSTKPDNLDWQNIWALAPLRDITRIPFNASNVGGGDALSAINSALVLGSILIPSGTYVVSGKIVVPSNRAIIIHPGATIQAINGANLADEGIFSLNLSNNVYIGGGGSIDGNKLNNALGRTNGIYILDSSNVLIENLTIKNCPGSTAQGGTSGDGIYVGGTIGSNNVTIQNCLIDSNIRTGISLAKGSTFNVSSNTISNTLGTANGYGIWVESPSASDALLDIKIEGNSFVNNEKNLVISANTAAGPCRVINNSFGIYRTGYNIFIKRSAILLSHNDIAVIVGDGIFIQNCGRHRILNNYIYGNNAAAENAGIRVADTFTAIIAKNNIAFTKGAGISVDQTLPDGTILSSFLNIDSNVLTNCGTTSSMSFQGPGVVAAIQYMHIVNNTITDSRGGSAATTGLGVGSIIDADIATWNVSGNIIFGPSAKSNSHKLRVFQKIHAEAVLDFGSLTGPNYQDLAVPFIGVAGGEAVSIGVPAAAMTANTIYQGFVNTTDQVTIRCIVTTGTVNPTSGTFKITVERDA